MKIVTYTALVMNVGQADGPIKIGHGLRVPIHPVQESLLLDRILGVRELTPVEASDAAMKPNKPEYADSCCLITTSGERLVLHTYREMLDRIDNPTLWASDRSPLSAPDESGPAIAHHKPEHKS